MKRGITIGKIQSPITQLRHFVRRDNKSEWSKSDA